MKTNYHILLAMVLAISSMGCKSISAPVRPSSSALAQRAVQFSPPPGKAAIYVIRPAQLVAAAQPMDVQLDNVRFGSVPPLAYLYGEVDPSEHCLVFTMRVGPSGTREYKFTVEAGRCYFFDVAVRVGGFRIKAIDEAEGRKLVQKYELSGDNRFERLLKNEDGP